MCIFMVMKLQNAIYDFIKDYIKVLDIDENIESKKTRT